MNFMDCSDEVVQALYEIVSVSQGAASKNRDASPEGAVGPVDLQDIDYLIDALHVLRPHLVEVSTFDAWMQIIREQWKDAIQTMTHVVDRRDDFTYGKAMLAYCLYMDNQPGWYALAEEVMARGEPEIAVQLIRTLEHYDAVREGKVTPEIFAEICKQNERMENRQEGKEVSMANAPQDFSSSALKA